MRPFSLEVSRDKRADWRVYRRAGLTFPAALSVPFSNGWPGFLAEETGKPLPPSVGQPWG